MSAGKHRALGPVTWLGERTISIIDSVGTTSLLLFQVVRAIPETLARKPGLRHGWENLIGQMRRVGVRAVGIVSLVTFAVGAILTLQLAPIMARYGAEAQAPVFVTISMLRELGPLIAAVVLTGFAGASIAAELGTMKVHEEIDALRSHAIPPLSYLVVPRVLATVVMTLCLVVLANLMGVLGGMVTAMLVMHAAPLLYLQRSFEGALPSDLYTGLIKGVVFGLLIGLIACRMGLGVSKSARSVGFATTYTVVATIVALIIADLAVTAVFYAFER